MLGGAGENSSARRSLALSFPQTPKIEKCRGSTARQIDYELRTEFRPRPARKARREPDPVSPTETEPTRPAQGRRGAKPSLADLAPPEQPVAPAPVAATEPPTQSRRGSKRSKRREAESTEYVDWVSGLGSASGFKLIIEDRGDLGIVELQHEVERVMAAGNGGHYLLTEQGLSTMRAEVSSDEGRRHDPARRRREPLMKRME